VDRARAGRRDRGGKFLIYKGILALIALSAGCFNPNIEDGQYACNPMLGSTGCPPGFACAWCGLCVRNTDAGLSLCEARADMSAKANDLTVNTRGCAVGQRAAGDLNFRDIAFCPAAWTVPGVRTPASLPPACNRMPGTFGMNCTVSDNCAAGWHVCNGDGDLGARGMTKNDCTRGPAGAWVTRQGGGDTNNCVAMGNNNVFGCGNGLPSHVASCAVLAISLEYGDCAMSNGVWACGVMTDGTAEALVVTKRSTADPGGVLCCEDPAK
jgi:hypothetical protein